MEIARLYLAAQRSFVELAESLSDHEWTKPVPCNPGWIVHDVVSHVAGVTDDILNQRLEGVASEPWTKAQVERWRDTPRAELIAQWNEQIAPVAEAVEAFGEHRPPFDCHMHEHDVRHALGRPANRDSELITTMVSRLAETWEGRPIDVTFADGTSLSTSGAGETRLGLRLESPFELARSRLGRRSRNQVTAWDWSEPLNEAELAAWFNFGPAETDIHE